MIISQLTLGKKVIRWQPRRSFPLFAADTSCSSGRRAPSARRGCRARRFRRDAAREFGPRLESWTDGARSPASCGLR